MNIDTLQEDILSYFRLSPDYGWMLSVFIVLLLTACASIGITLLFRLLLKSMSKTKTRWDDILLEAVRRPLKILIWIFGVFYAVDLLIDESRAEIFEDIMGLRDVAFVVMFGWALIRFIGSGEDYFIEARRAKGKNVDLTTTNAVAKLLKISVLISAVLIALQSLGISVGGVLAFGGIGGIAVGFAAKDMLANFFGAMIIYLDKPFRVGDWIRSPDQEIEGTVEHIGWRMTTIRTFDKRPLYVPNAAFTTISVENPSRMSHRRIYLNIGIRYDDIGVMKAVVDDVRAMLQAHEAIDTAQTLIVHFNAFSASSCDFMVYCFTHTTNWIEYHGIREDVLLKIAAMIDKHGAEIAYPTQVEYSLVKNLDKARPGGGGGAPEPEAG